MDLRCSTHPSPGQHLDFIYKNVIDIYRIYTVSLPNLVLSICRLNKKILFVAGGEWCTKLGVVSPEQNMQGRHWSAQTKT